MAVSRSTTERSSRKVERLSGRQLDVSPLTPEVTTGKGDELLTALFYLDSTGLAAVSERGRFIRVNPALCKLLGYSQKELLGHRLNLIFGFDQWRALSKAVKDVLSGTKERVQLSTTCLHKDGKLINSLVLFSLVTGLQSNEQCFFIAVHDTTVFQWTQREALETRHYYQTISDNAFDAVLVFENGVCIDANPAAEEMFGIPLKEFVGMNGEALAVPENRTMAQERIASDDESPYHAVAMKRDGTRFHVMVQVKVINMGDRTVRMTMLRDIDRRVKAEVALEDSERHLRSLMESATDFVLFRLRRNPENLYRPDIIFISPSIRDFLDSSWVPDFQEWLEMLHPDDCKVLLETTTRMVESQRLDRRVRIRNSKNGSWRWLRIVCATVGDENGDLFFNGIILDETGEVEAVEALKARERELRLRTESLSEANTALEVLLRKREADRADVEEKMLGNAKNLILPYIQKLKNSRLDKRQQLYLSLVESNINEFISPLSQRMSHHYLAFTPLEIQVADLVKEGKTTKDIANILDLSTRTIESVRYTIRRKLGITEKRASLRNHLLCMDGGGSA